MQKTLTLTLTISIRNIQLLIHVLKTELGPSIEL